MSKFRLGLRYFGGHAHRQRIQLSGDRCILFLYTNPEAEAGQYRLILAANRDEYFKRPAKQAHFWEDYPAILGGRDMEPGREGGTWLAMSKFGRMSALLNVMGGTFNDMRSRGWLVPEYLTTECNTEQHLSNLQDSVHEYSLFNLLAIDVRREYINVQQLSNAGGTRRTYMTGRGFLGLGNHLLSHPTLKVSAGLSRFSDVVEKLGYIKEEDKLLDELLALLKWDKK